MSEAEQDDIQTIVTKLDGRVGTIESSIASISADVKTLTHAVNASQRTPWGTVLAGSALVLTLVTGAWKIVELNTALSLAPIAVQNTVSITDRTDLRRDLERTMEGLNKETSSRQEGFAALQQQTVEGETQHRMRDAVAQLQFQHIEGWVAWLYQYSKLPAPSPMSYAPSIGREINTPIPNQ